MWQPMTGPRGTIPLTKMMPCVEAPFAQICQYETATSSTAMSSYGCHINMYGQATSACTDCKVSVLFFPCLTIRTDRSISRSRCPFETKWVALDSWRWGLRSRLFWDNFENIYFWAKIWPLVQILITPSHWKAFGPTKDYDYLSELQYSSSFKLYQLILLEKSFQ